MDYLEFKSGEEYVHSMNNSDYYSMVKYEAAQEYITQLIAFLIGGASNLSPEHVKSEVDSLVQLKRKLVPDDRVDEVTRELVSRSKEWGFPNSSSQPRGHSG